MFCASRPDVAECGNRLLDDEARSQAVLRAPTADNALVAMWHEEAWFVPLLELAAGRQAFASAFLDFAGAEAGGL